MDRVRSGRQGVDVLGRRATLRRVHGHRIAVCQPHRGSLAGLDLTPRDQALDTGVVADDHAGSGQPSDFDDLAVIGENGLAAGDQHVMHTIIEAHAIADGQRQLVDVPLRPVASKTLASSSSSPVRRRSARMAAPISRALAFVGAETVGLNSGSSRLASKSLAPQPGDALHRRLPVTGHQFGGAVLLFHFQGFGRPISGTGW